MNTGGLSYLNSISEHRLTLCDREIHIWTADLEPCSSSLGDYTVILSPFEVERANTYKFAAHRNRFLLSRSILKLLLGGYLRRDPGQIALTAGPDGKLFIPSESNPSRITFNVSHSHELAVYAIAVGREIGIDVEYIRGIDDPEALVQNVLSEQEQKDFRMIPERGKLKTFLAYWVRKEAYLKATGEGLARDMRSIEFSRDTQEDFHLERVDGNNEAPRRWFVSKLELPEEYIGAVTAAGSNCAVRYVDRSCRLY